MKIIKYLLLLFLSFKTFGQTESRVFYNEGGEKITKEHFYRSRDHNKNLDVYVENDSVQVGLLLPRKNYGHLDQKIFTRLKSYLAEESLIEIDPGQNIVINYLTALPENIKDTETRSHWNIFNKNYLKKLHKIADIRQFWISSPDQLNLKYYHQNKINWITDEENLLKKLFFPYELMYGNYVLIRPDGKFYSYLGEHGKQDIWEDAKRFFE